MINNWLETIDNKRTLEVKTRAEKAKLNTQHLEKLIEDLVGKEGSDYANQIKSINVNLKYLLADISRLSYFQDSADYNTANLSEENVDLENVKTKILRLSNDRIYITTILPQKGPKGQRTIDTHVGKMLEAEIEKFIKTHDIETPIYEKARITMIFNFGPEIPQKQIPDPDNICIKGILDAMQMKIIKNDNLIDIGLSMRGKLNSKSSFLEIVISPM